METLAFEAEKRAVETIHFKYERRSTLCWLGVVSCDRPPPFPNRLWTTADRPAPAGKVIGRKKGQAKLLRKVACPFFSSTQNILPFAGVDDILPGKRVAK